MPYSQRAIIEKVDAYLAKKRSEEKKSEEKKADTTPSITPLLERGYCHGLALLWLYKMSERNEKWFYDIVKAIIDTPLKDIDNFEANAEKFIAHVEWLQNPDKYVSTIRQMDCDKTLEVKKELPISSVFEPRQLDPVLDMAVQPNKMVCISGPNHSVGVMRRGSSYYIYNPNYSSGQAKVLDSVKQLRLELIQCLFKDFRYSDAKMAIIINVLGEDNMTETRTTLHNWLIDTTGVARVCEEGIGSLYLACENNNDELACTLLRNGANPNAPTKNARYPLHLACYSGYILLVDLLLEYKADPNIDGMQGLPLYLACKHGHEKVVKRLLEANADVNKQDRDGESSMFASIQSEHKKLTRLLLDQKADPLLARKDGVTPMDLAIEQQDWETIALMMKNITFPHARNIPILRSHQKLLIAATKQLLEEKAIKTVDSEKILRLIDEISKKTSQFMKPTKAPEHTRIGILEEAKPSVGRDGFFSGADVPLFGKSNADEVLGIGVVVSSN